MPRKSSSRDGAVRADGGRSAPAVSAPIDLGLVLSVYGKRADGSIVEIGDPASPLAHQPTSATWPTEQ